MSPKLLFSSLVLALVAGVALASTDFSQQTLPTYKQGLLPLQPGTLYYNFVRNTLKAPMGQTGAGIASSTNDDSLVQSGQGVAVELIPGKDVNVHVNYNAQPTSGRSYGWTSDSGGMVGDWSDAGYLTNLWTVVSKSTDQDFSTFYQAIVQMVGASDVTALGQLTTLVDPTKMTERVAVNFLAIYTAEEYRATLGTRNWDDAIFDVTLLAGFHAGQDTFTLYYGKKPGPAPVFTTVTYDQGPGVDGVAHEPQTAKTKSAALIDYWQYTANPQEKNSGINETRPDFTELGLAITKWENSQGGSGKDLITKIEAIVGNTGGHGNVFEDVTQYYTSTPNKADPGVASTLAPLVAQLELQIKADANAITSSLKPINTPTGAAAQPASPTPPTTPPKKGRRTGTDQSSA